MNFEPIGVIHSDFKEKFGVPRQSLMISEARAVLKLNPNQAFLTALNHLDRFSHVWIVFVFHQADDREWTPTIKPPRIGAPNRVGVFASRSPHRPNPIGISAVKLDRIDLEAKGGIEIHLSGIDLLDGTPVLDLKPYIPYADSIPEANAGWAEGKIPKYPVSFSDESLTFIDGQSARFPHLLGLLTQTLEYDPRPTSYRQSMPIEDMANDSRVFKFRIMDFDVHWHIEKHAIRVDQIILAVSSS
jgi:tRNA-Thr(GGU) m(6)t(6)A37 methyltransferase TsaA